MTVTSLLVAVGLVKARSLEMVSVISKEEKICYKMVYYTFII